MVGRFPDKRSTERGFTLVELLVVIAVIGILVGLLLPAIQSSREAARKTECKNHLKQMSLGFLNHESAQGFLPSSGWGNKWVGDPDGGFGATQPGGWAYSVLPYMGYNTLWDAGNRLSDVRRVFGIYPDKPSVQSLQRLVTTIVPLFNCPSKRGAQLYPMDSAHGDLAHNVPGCSAATECAVVRGDYLVNSGNVGVGDMPGPARPAAPPWYQPDISPAVQSGISFQCSEVRIKDLVDGSSKTAMVGEKYENPNSYYTGADDADNQCVFSGHDSDNNGYTGRLVDGAATSFSPKQDRVGHTANHYFGSNHSEGLHMAYCDGSVHFIEYGVSGRVWYRLGGRNDDADNLRFQND